MQDVLKEADLSAGAVYRRFSGKVELIAALVTEVLDTVRDIYERAALESPPPTPDVLIPRTLAHMKLAHMKEERPAVLDSGEWMIPRLMVQVWTETLRNAELAAVLEPGFGKVRAAWAKLVEGYKDAGLMPAHADADAMARVVIGLTQGFATQMALFGGVSEQVLRDGLRALMSMDGAGSTARNGSQLG
jgi:AcrR family transcriptional regulator